MSRKSRYTQRSTRRNTLFDSVDAVVEYSQDIYIRLQRGTALFLWFLLAESIPSGESSDKNKTTHWSNLNVC